MSMHWSPGRQVDRPRQPSAPERPPAIGREPSPSVQQLDQLITDAEIAVLDALAHIDNLKAAYGHIYEAAQANAA